MRSTIDLLEVIGRNASLRHARAEDLANTLAAAQASTALKAAALTGDRTYLSAELGQTPTQAPQISQTPAQEEDDTSEDPLTPSPTNSGKLLDRS